MATPAARTLQKRYTAGSCTLDVELQLLALSKWYPQPIAQDLQFKLWMNIDAAATGSAPLPTAKDLSSEPAEPAELVAQGDRAALQTLSQAVSKKVRGLLAIAHLNTPNTNRPRPPVSPSPLPGLTLTQPLSYLQICDLSSVLYQCEQATPALPVSLSIAETAVKRAAEPRRNNVIPFAAIRRRPPLWASSAAAALLAVGLTTTLWPSLQSNPSTTAGSGTADLKTDPSLERPNASPQNSKNPSATGNTVARAPSNASKTPAADAPTAPATNSARDSAARNSATAPLADPAPSTTPVPESAAERDRNLTAKQPTPANEPLPNPPNAVTAPAPNPAAAPAAPPPAARSQEAARSANLPEAAPPDNSQTSGAESFSTAEGLDENELSSAATSNQNLAQQDLIAIEQVQNYFQSQWQATSSSQTLSYEVQLSETGEVVSFVALSEAAERYRDRLLPDNQPLMFAPSSTGAGLTLQLDLLPNGEVQVYQL